MVNEMLTMIDIKRRSNEMCQKILVILSQLCSFRTLWLENSQESFFLIGNHCNSDICALISKSAVILYHKNSLPFTPSFTCFLILVAL